MTNTGCTSSTTPRTTSIAALSRSPKGATFPSQITTASASIHANCIVPKAISTNHQHPTGTETKHAVAASGKKCPGRAVEVLAGPRDKDIGQRSRRRR